MLCVRCSQQNTGASSSRNAINPACRTCTTLPCKLFLIYSCLPRDLLTTTFLTSWTTPPTLPTHTTPSSIPISFLGKDLVQITSLWNSSWAEMGIRHEITPLDFLWPVHSKLVMNGFCCQTHFIWDCSLSYLFWVSTIYSHWGLREFLLRPCGKQATYMGFHVRWLTSPYIYGSFPNSFVVTSNPL